MVSVLNPYLVFDGNAREAMEYYRDVLGGELNINTFGEFGQSGATADKVMHARLKSDAGVIMASDTAPGMAYEPGRNFSISLSGENADELRGYWNGLSKSGTVTMPLEKQIWGDEFGACVDRFGISWMVNINSR
ncbi:VOC family protein [Glycomyces sp. L485]|uniref:VOC family protein n=1 Tax=Glycomyces sp. L485 TaxID=2909235 RepID=UPI001F4A227C|nr:VOC family protein [Glycomyces sp. L485]MCH7231488.1 VOC family protein [Glycomyces sp. L485]